MKMGERIAEAEEWKGAPAARKSARGVAPARTGRAEQAVPGGRESTSNVLRFCHPVRRGFVVEFLFVF
jgi:hypothetical protein